MTICRQDIAKGIKMSKYELGNKLNQAEIL